MFFPVSRPTRQLCRSRLLLTTALISAATLTYLPAPAQAQMYLDNTNPGDGFIETESGYWSNSSAIWTDANGLNEATLPGNETGVLTAATMQTPITLTILSGLFYGDLSVGGLRVDSGQYTLTGGDLSRGADVLSFSVATDASLYLDTDVDAAGGTITISGDGDLTFNGDVDADTISSSGNVRMLETVTSDVINDTGGNLGLGGR